MLQQDSEGWMWSCVLIIGLPTKRPPFLKEKYVNKTETTFWAALLLLLLLILPQFFHQQELHELTSVDDDVVLLLSLHHVQDGGNSFELNIYKSWQSS